MKKYVESEITYLTDEETSEIIRENEERHNNEMIELVAQMVGELLEDKIREEGGKLNKKLVVKLSERWYNEHKQEADEFYDSIQEFIDEVKDNEDLIIY